MKRLFAVLAIAAMLIGIPVYAESNDPAKDMVLIFNDSDQKLALVKTFPAKDYSGNPAIAIMLAYQNLSSDPHMLMTQYFITCYQNGMQLQTTFTFDSSLTEYTTTGITNIKDGAVVVYIELMGLKDSVSPVEVEISNSLFGGNKVSFTVDPTVELTGAAIMGVDPQAEAQTEEPETEPIDWEARYYDLLEKYNALLEQQQ